MKLLFLFLTCCSSTLKTTRIKCRSLPSNNWNVSYRHDGCFWCWFLTHFLKTFYFLWRFWSESSGIMDTENRLSLHWNHLTMWVLNFKKFTLHFCQDALEQQTFSLCIFSVLYLRQIYIYNIAESKCPITDPFKKSSTKFWFDFSKSSKTGRMVFVQIWEKKNWFKIQVCVFLVYLTFHFLLQTGLCSDSCPSFWLMYPNCITWYHRRISE